MFLARFVLSCLVAAVAATVAAAPSPLEIKRAQFRELTQRDESGELNPTALLNALAQRKALEAAAPSQSGRKTAAGAGISQLSWTSLGPTNVGGRTLGMAIHPQNTARIWIATPGGGVWTSADRGAHWAPVNDYSPTLITNSVLIDPRSTNVMYVATGENGYDNPRGCCMKRGLGIFKSTDDGASFSQLPATDPKVNSDWYNVYLLAMHPADSNLLFAATHGGIYRSTDGGNSWSHVYSTLTLNFAFDPNNTNRILAGGVAGEVASSADGGQTWSRVTITAGATSVNPAFAKTVPGLVYAQVFAGDGAFYRSVDGGTTWSLISSPDNLTKDECNVLWVDPFDSDHILIGGERLMRSTDGGVTFKFISNEFRTTSNGVTIANDPIYSPHTDMHAIVADPGYNGSTNRTIYVMNDGGVYRADDITKTTSGNTANGWTPLNTGFVTAQFYSGAGNPASVLIGGTQDSGSLRYSGTGTTWTYFGGGDGGFTAVDSANPNLVYTEYIDLSIYRRADGGTDPSDYQSDYLCGPEAGASDLVEGCFSGGGNANFIAPFILDPNNSNRMLAGANSLWVSNNIQAANPTWTAIKPRSVGLFTGLPNVNYVSAVAVAPGNSNVIWVGHNNGEIYRTLNGTSANPVWTLVSSSLPARWVGRILIDADNANTVYVAFTAYAVTTGNLRKTADGGANWSNISGNLPLAPIRTVVRHPTNANWLYVGTEVGVFSSMDGGATWSTTTDGPAAVTIEELFWMDPGTLGAATYGRGMWKAAIQASPTVSPQAGYWWNPAEGGRGYTLEYNGSNMFVASYLYNASGRSTWYAAGPAPLSGATFSAPLAAYTGGQTLTGSFKPAAQAASPGSITITFSDASHGTITWPGGIVPIQRYEFTPGGLASSPGPTQPQSGYWWNPAEGGRGYTVEVQKGLAFIAGYMYDTAGNAVWYATGPASLTQSNAYQGSWATYTGGQTLTGSYQPATISGNAGAVTIQFSSPTAGLLTLPNGRQIPIQRFGF